MAAVTRSRGYLPHWEGEREVYFVTFRLADSLPQELLARLRRERRLLERAGAADVDTGADRARFRSLQDLLRKAERCLDTGLGRCSMRDFRIAKTVADAILHFRGKRYRLVTWCVMPNHVHVVFSPFGEHNLQTIVHSWKSFSAKAANRLLGQTGRFWQREYFDHLIRDRASLSRIIRYVRENPEKAGLRDWPWVGMP